MQDITNFVPGTEPDVIWKRDGDLICGICRNGDLFVRDEAGGVMIPSTELNRKIILERFRERSKERRLAACAEYNPAGRGTNG